MASSKATGISVLVLKEGTSRRRGAEAQSFNFQAVITVTDILKSSLGPMGSDKMLVDGFGDVAITSDGATILEEMEIEHPAAKLLTEASKALDKEVGDGTTSLAVLTGALIKEAIKLLDAGIHPTIITEGYKAACDQAVKVFEEMAIKVQPTDRKILAKVTETSMSGSLVSESRKKLSDMAIEAVLKVAKKSGENYEVDLDNIKIEKKPGESLNESFLIDGVALDKEVVHPAMPKRVENCSVALLSCSLEIEKTEIDEKLSLEDPLLIKQFLKAEEELLKNMVDKVIDTGAKAVFCQKGIDDLAQYYLAKKGIIAVRRVKKSDMEKLEMATKGKIVNTIEELTKKDLGRAGLIEERKIGGEKWVFVENVPASRTATILLRGGSQRIVDEAERAMKDATSVIKEVLMRPAVLPGGGAPEAEAATRLRMEADKVKGRMQLIYNAFANALESIPLALAENAGIDMTTAIAELRAAHSKGMKNDGIDVEKMAVSDCLKKGVLDPLGVKRSVVLTATEVANSILRIDDIIAASKMKEPKTPPPTEGY
ncbi:MAG: thermosome subunit alpha [Thermoproteota archaeon]